MIGAVIHRILFLLVVTSVAVGAVEYTPERYDVIIDRSPFGEDPLIAQQEQQEQQDQKEAQAASAAAKKLEKEMRLCYLLETDSGEVRAGFQNLKARVGDPKSVMLTVGESFNGMKLSSVDVENSSATLSLNGKPVIFELTQAAAVTPDAKKKPQSERKFGGGFKRKSTSESTEKEEPTLTSEEQAAKREEVRENLRQYQMEVLRSGMPPLPIALTQEMDDQLVSEGVLPAMDE
jgi:hypothetical protein